MHFAMINSLFVLNGAGEAIIEKHWRGNARRNEPLTFWGELVKSGTARSVAPFLPTARGVLVHLRRAGLYFLASVEQDASPLFVTTFLSTLADTFEDYFGELNEHAIKDHFITVYELLDEMLDNGYPLTMEPNALKEVIPPPSMLNRVIESLSSVGVGGDSSLSSLNKPSITHARPSMLWRRANVRYAQNEIFVDIIETIDAVLGASGSVQHARINGEIRVNSRLSGLPDVTMSLRCAHALDDTCFHHCVDAAAYSSRGVLKFIPPDGPSTLMRYVIRGNDARSLQPPLTASSRISFNSTTKTGAVSVSLHPSLSAVNAAQARPAAGSLMLASVITGKGVPGSQDATVMDGVRVTLPFGRFVTSVALSANYGTVQFDAVSGIVEWNVGAIPKGKTPALIGDVTLSEKGAPVTPPVLVQFRVPGQAPSGMIVDRLELAPLTKYKYYKGLRCVTKSGNYEIRT